MLSRIIRSLGNFYFLHLMNQWVAGSSVKDAVSCCRKLGSMGSGCMINHLGEHYTEAAMAKEAVEEYKKLIDQLSLSGTAACLTIKPSQFGFNTQDAPDPEKFCRQEMLEVVRHASGKNVFVWLDMEDSRFTDFTLDFYEEFVPAFLLGICLQANLLRTRKDLDRMIGLCKTASVRVRLVKGIYPEKNAISDPGKLHSRFLGLIRYAFEKSPPSFGIAVGSHHAEAIELALALQKKYKKQKFEIQVLKGVLPDYCEELRKRGVSIVEYVPYGHDAFAYSVRRARKNPRYAHSRLFSLFFDAYKKLYH
jgi:proline dehydrogenase